MITTAGGDAVTDGRTHLISVSAEYNIKVNVNEKWLDFITHCCQGLLYTSLGLP